MQPDERLRHAHGPLAGSTHRAVAGHDGLRHLEVDLVLHVAPRAGGAARLEADVLERPLHHRGLRRRLQRRRAPLRRPRLGRSLGRHPGGLRLRRLRGGFHPSRYVCHPLKRDLTHDRNKQSCHRPFDRGKVVGHGPSCSLAACALHPAPQRGSGMLVVVVLLCNAQSSAAANFSATQWRKINALSFLVGGGLLWSRRTLLGVF
mmetsp:Transcript_109587/g.353615  ORF Transcript_109587/g.353615 Transcript_109587/m.353615 type:complete len:204 (+) Transcript_109587:339-950(+)